jgi:hypothetical protein
VLRALLLDIATGADEIPAAELERAAARIQSAPDPEAGSRATLLEAIDADADAWARLPELGDSGLLAEGLTRTWAKARGLGVEALREHDPERLHRWRRWVKYLRYQLEPLSRPGRAWLVSAHTELDGLGSLLGARNDLENLREAVRDDAPPALGAAIERRDAVLAAALPELSRSVLWLEPDDLVPLLVADLGAA